MQRNIWIIGGGISGSFAALRLVRLGYSVSIWRGRIAGSKAVESITREVRVLLEEVGVGDCIARSDGYISGDFCSIERSAFAEALLDKARRAGAELKNVREMRLPWEEHCDALIDATGRSAAFSGTVRRLGRDIADLYEVELRDCDTGLQIVQSAHSWAYCMRSRSVASVAVITRHGENMKQATADAFDQFKISHSTASFIERRFCSPQWTEEPITANRISIGDAAFAYYPLAGTGIRFALTTAVAAAAVLHTRWVVPAAKSLATEYYGELCEAARVSHISNLTRIPTVPLVSHPDPLVFKAREIDAGVQQGDFIVSQKTYLLADGSRLRWLGSLDLADLRQLTISPIPRRSLAPKLAQLLPVGTDVERLIDWCVRHEVLG